MTVEPFEIGRWWVKSRSRPSLRHLVEIESDGSYQCGCEAFQLHTDLHGQICPHIEAVVNYVQAATAPPHAPAAQPQNPRHARRKSALRLQRRSKAGHAAVCQTSRAPSEPAENKCQQAADRSPKQNLRQDVQNRRAFLPEDPCAHQADGRSLDHTP